MRASDGSVVKLECHNALPSTAQLAREYAKRGYPDRYVVFAEGRKKLDQEGRFRGEIERGVFMSCILRPSIFPSQAALISSISAVAMTTALLEHTTATLGIGWVSKIYCNGKIIGECTIEGKLDNFTSYEYIIVTFSAVLSKEDFPPRITDLIRKVFESENTSVPIIIAKNILNKFFPLYSNVKNHTKYMDIYRKMFVLRGEKIKYLNNGKKQTCKVLGIDQDTCALMVEDSKRDVIYISTPNKVTIPKRIQQK
jgi:BirA family biotin operon repressor/biotin-[acetyl-CoA-carboxylase] ligase